MGDLSLPDQYGVGRLKNLRQRSLSDPRFRDDQYVRKMVTVRPPLRWDRVSPLSPYREDVVRNLDDVARAKSAEDATTVDAAWRKVVDSIDALIAEGERVNGERITTWA